jgi:hypothetical protein
MSTAKPLVPALAVVASRDTKRLSRFIPIAAEAFTGTMGGDAMGRRPSSVQVLPYSPTTPGVALPQSAHTVASRKFNLEFTPTSPTFSSWSASRTTLGLGKERDEEEEDVFEKEKEVVAMSGSHGAGLREKRVRKRWDDAKISPLTTVKVDSKNNVPSPEHDGFLGDCPRDLPDDPVQTSSLPWTPHMHRKRGNDPRLFVPLWPL